MVDITAFFDVIELRFIINLALCLLAGFLVGIERQTTGKPAGISTHCFVMAGAMMFTMLSVLADPDEPARIAAQIITGVGFLGAGIIIQNEGKVTNLTTAASIWMSAAIGMAIGFHLYLFAILGTVYALIVPKISGAVKEKLRE
jgi:putative Mg2+ transporter-C (MgtC) family protein